MRISFSVTIFFMWNILPVALVRVWSRVFCCCFSGQDLFQPCETLSRCHLLVSAKFFCFFLSMLRAFDYTSGKSWLKWIKRCSSVSSFSSAWNKTNCCHFGRLIVNSVEISTSSWICSLRMVLFRVSWNGYWFWYWLHVCEGGWPLSTQATGVCLLARLIFI